EDTLFAIASSETNKKYLNAEMTDFAILPEYRGKNLSLLLLCEMEKNMKDMGYKLLYTIARAVSYGMNCTFSKLGYQFSGTLINNTNISGNIESMNLWYKVLD
ncbi:MAG: putative beta-lysine N-acetyltransferase, partial [Bacillota bacterium]